MNLYAMQYTSPHAGMDHLYPVMYRSQLKGSKMQTENGLKKVKIFIPNSPQYAVNSMMYFIHVNYCEFIACTLFMYM